MLKVIIPDAFRSNEKLDAEQEIFDKHKILFQTANCRTDEEVIEKCKSADGIITIYADVNAKVIAKLEKCKVIVRFGIGYDNIDVQAATNKRIFVCNVPDFCIEEVAAHTMALILGIQRKITLYDAAVRKGEWGNLYTGYPLRRLSNQTLGLIGFGNTARETARYAAPFGFKIVAYDPYAPGTAFEEHRVRKVDMDELLSISDIVSIHIPLNENTRHLINKELISRMKDNVVVINTSRGPIIAQDDLIDALKSRKILAAGLDVFESEPIGRYE